MPTRTPHSQTINEDGDRNMIVPKRTTLMSIGTVCIGACLAILFRDQDPVSEAGNTVPVDENLFLYRVLEMLYDEWPTDPSDADSFWTSTDRLRTTALRFKEHLRRNPHLEQDLDMLFDDFLSCLDDYCDFLEDIEMVDKHSEHQFRDELIITGTEFAKQ